MSDNCKEHVLTKFADLGGYEDDLSFDLHYYLNNRYYSSDGDPPNVIYLFDGPFNSSLLSNLSQPWVQFAQEQKSMLYGVELRGKGKSKIEGHNPDLSQYFTPKHHIDDILSIQESACTEYGIGPWLIVGEGSGAILAIWSRVAEKGSFKCACATDPDLSKLDKLNGKSFVDYAPSNLILVGSNKEKFDELKTLASSFDQKSANIFVFEENDQDGIVAKLKEICSN